MINNAPNALTLNIGKKDTIGSSRVGAFIIYLGIMCVWGCDDNSGGGGESVQRGLSPSQLKRLKNAPPPTAKKTKAQGTPQEQKLGADISSLLVIPNRLKRVELMESSGWDDFKRIRERIKNARDPFWPNIPELKDQDEVEVDPSSVQQKLIVKVPETVLNLKFKGTLTGMSANLAMLENSAGTGYTVRVGDIVGKSSEFVRVKMITNNKITFEPVLGISENEPKDSPRLVKVLREGEEQRATELGVEP